MLLQGESHCLEIDNCSVRLGERIHSQVSIEDLALSSCLLQQHSCGAKDDGKSAYLEIRFQQNGGVDFDDVDVPGTQDSKGRYSIPFLCSQGFEIKIRDYQAILQKKLPGQHC